MIVQVAPVEKNVGETLASLNFAQRVRTVELGAASRHMENGDAKLNAEARNLLFQRNESSPEAADNKLHFSAILSTTKTHNANAKALYQKKTKQTLPLATIGWSVFSPRLLIWKVCDFWLIRFSAFV